MDGVGRPPRSSVRARRAPSRTAAARRSRRPWCSPRRHCDLGDPRVFVSFDGAITEDSGLLPDAFHGHPGYDQVPSDPHDIAVVVPDRPVKGITPAKLPAAGALDAFSVGAPFAAAGYGSGGEPARRPGQSPCRRARVRHDHAQRREPRVAWLRLSQATATGGGGTCDGDSGGPDFIGSGSPETTTIAGTTSTGDAFRNACNVTCRLDTPSARASLGRFVVLP